MQGLKCYETIDQHDAIALFVEQYAYLINKIAKHIKSRLPVTVELDDLIQSGLIGLLEAKNTFSSDAGASFETYASLKIRFAIYEFVRKHSGITRDISQNIKKIAEVVSRIENKEGDVLSDKRVAEELGISMKKYSDMTCEINAYKSISVYDDELVENVASDDVHNPLHTVEMACQNALIKEVLSQLPQREQLVLALYYNEQMSLKEIATILDLTEARVSQIHSTLLVKLKRKLTPELEYQYD